MRLSIVRFEVYPQRKPRGVKKKHVSFGSFLRGCCAMKETATVFCRAPQREIWTYEVFGLVARSSRMYFLVKCVFFFLVGLVLPFCVLCVVREVLDLTLLNRTGMVT